MIINQVQTFKNEQPMPLLNIFLKFTFKVSVIP